MSTEYVLWEDPKTQASISLVERSSMLGFLLAVPCNREATDFNLLSTPDLDPMVIAEAATKALVAASYSVEDPDQFWKDVLQHMQASIPEFKELCGQA